MIRHAQRAALGGAVALLLLTVPALAQDTAVGSTKPATLTVQETGEASAAPDLARVSFTVLRSAETAREALDAANEAMAAVQSGMQELGIETRDLQTSGFSIEPRYEHDQDRNGVPSGPPRLTGYDVRQTLDVRVRDVAKVGTVLDQAVTLGVNAGGSISFEMEDPSGLRDEARREAIRRAKEAAEIMAEAAGVELGTVRRIRDNLNGGPRPLGAPMMRMEAASVPVQAGETTVTATVTVTFEIEDSPANP